MVLVVIVECHLQATLAERVFAVDLVVACKCNSRIAMEVVLVVVVMPVELLVVVVTEEVVTVVDVVAMEAAVGLMDVEVAAMTVAVVDAVVATLLMDVAGMEAVEMRVVEDSGESLARVAAAVGLVAASILTLTLIVKTL